MKNIAWKLRTYTKGDEIGILDLDRRVFSEQSLDRFSKEYWEWEFVKNPDGRSNIWLADDDGEIVGHYAIIPRLWKIDGEYHMGSIVVDVMTDERYRFQGMFAALGKTALADAGQKGILFSYGFPVRNDVMPGHLKVGWEHIFDLPVMVYPQNFTPVVQYYLSNNMISQLGGTLLNILWQGFRKADDMTHQLWRKRKGEYRIHEANEFTEDFDHLWQRASNQFAIISSRTSEYLKWRYTEHPYYKYKVLAAYKGDELVGYVILKEEKILGLDCGVIVDVFVEFEHIYALDLLVDRVKADYKSKKEIALIALMISKLNPYYKLFKRHGFILSPKKFWFIIHKNLDFLAFNPERLYNQAHWLLTWGDTDVI